MHTYAISAVDNQGNESAKSAPVSVTTPSCPTITTTTSSTTTTLPPDACASPIVIPPGGGTFAGTTSGTGTLSGTCGYSLGSPEKVFAWTPGVSGTATIQTCGAGTNYDTILYMRSGGCQSGLEVACNDDACPNSTGLARASQITVNVTAGQGYFIVVDGDLGASGTFSLTVTPPSGAVTTTTTSTTQPPTTTSTSTTTTTTTTTRPPTTTSTSSTTTTTLLPPPPVPTGLSTTTMSCQEVDLRWTLSSGTVSGYNVYRKRTTDVSYTMLTQLGATPALPIRDTTASGSSAYSYGVATFNQCGTSLMATALVNTPTCPVVGTGQLRWAKRWGGAGSDMGQAIATDGGGNVLVGGSF